ncbi:MFS transporter [Candidatus Laterigemmans baculatus]|uniref:MFS transporter n=1 Tax=Candidatus Laterigemmans baculatus TaxID=2770505 RepID=UPI0013D98A18|nr:MFS transporter [Candidatus Laterigemmans baculatus]
MTDRLAPSELHPSDLRPPRAETYLPESRRSLGHVAVPTGDRLVPDGTAGGLEAEPVSPPPSALAAAWHPLRIPMYRAFWMASLMSNLGTWIHEVGASWLMTQLDPSPVMVSSVRAAMALPMLLLALPAGVLADRIDRRRLLIGTQWWMLLTAVLLATLAFQGWVTPWVLLMLTAATGLGMVLHGPTWQASIPELVPRHSLASAIALGSISFNLARSAGPALGGLMVAWLGSWSAFAINAGSFAGVIGVLMCWKRSETESAEGRSFLGSLGDGLRFASGDRTMRHVLVRVGLYVLPAGALWSLLPLVAHDMLQWNALGYGVLVGGIGLGAVLAAIVLPLVRGRWGADRTLVVSHLATAAALALTALSPSRTGTALLMLLAGGGWMMTLTTLNSTAQMTLPRKLRARGMGSYLTAFAAAMSGGALLWGGVARACGLSTALATASLVLLASIAAGRMLPLGDSDTGH